MCSSGIGAYKICYVNYDTGITVENSELSIPAPPKLNAELLL